MEQNISEKSKLYKSAYMSKDEVLSLFGEDISNDKLSEFLDKYITVPTTELYEFLLTCKDFTDKGVNLILNDDVKLFLRIRNHEQRGTWYDDNYTPYCAQNQIKCSGPRMQLTDYGYKCPECKNEISFTGVRLNESPLNKFPIKLQLAGKYGVVGNTEALKELDKQIVEEITSLDVNVNIGKIKMQQKIGRYVRDEKEKVIATEKPTSMYPDVKRDLDSIEDISKAVVQAANVISNVAVFGNNPKTPEEIKIYMETNNIPISMIHNVVITKEKYLQLDKLSKEGSYGNKLTKFNLVEDLLLLEDNSITDSDLIRAIALWGIENNSNMLNSKIKSELEFAGLYPHVMKAVSYDEVVENPEFKELVESISESGRNNLQMLKDAFEQKPIDDWVPLEQMLEHFKNSNNINIRIDTRDFCCIESKRNRFDELSHHTKDSIVKYFRRFMYTKDEVIECMKIAFEKSGGEGEWRMLNYKGYPETYNWQLKYLNIIYIGNNIQHSSDNNLQYIITSNDDRLLNKNMWNTEINDELLGFH